MSPSQVVETCSIGIVVLGVLLAASRSISRSIRLLAAQSILVGLAAIGVALTTGAEHLIAGGLLACVVKGIVIPLVLSMILRGSPVRVERHPYLGPRTGLVVAVLIVFAADAAVAGIDTPSATGDGQALAAAVATVLTGLLLVMTRRKAVSLLVGLFVFENGIALAAFALTYGMPLVVELGVLFDLLLVVVVGWVTTQHMVSTFGSASTDQLRRLRG